MSKRIVIIGGSASGHSVAKQLRGKNKDCQITLLTEEKYPCYDRRKLYAYLAGKAREKDLFLCNADFYARENITFMNEVKAVNLNCDRRTVYLKHEDSRDSVKYDILVICAGSRVVPPEIPGSHKEGIFTLDTLADVKAAKSAVINGPVCLYGKWDPRAAEIARLFIEEKKDVLLVTPEPPREEIIPGVQVITSTITEMIGESGLQAVKFAEGKIIGTSFLVFTGPCAASIEFLEETDLRRENGCIVVDGAFRSSRENVFACGPVTGAAVSWDQAVAGAVSLADTLAATLQK